MSDEYLLLSYGHIAAFLWSENGRDHIPFSALSPTNVYSPSPSFLSEILVKKV